MEKIRVDGANGIRFSTRKIFSSGNGLPFNGAFTSTAASESISRIPKTDINPNKAIFTIDSKSSNILIVNNKACELLDYRPSELCDMQFLSLLTNKTNKKSYVSALAEGQLNTTDGTMVLLSGKVVEMTTKKGSKVAVSLWIRQIDADVGRMLCVAEPVQRRIAQIVVDKNGKIISTDDETFMLFQIDTDEIYGSDIRHLIPAIQLPNAENSSNHKTIYKQKATGKAKDNLSFPLCLMIAPKTEAESAATSVSSDCGIGGDSIPNTYVITIWVFQNISGLVVIDESGSIELCNHHFSMLMFGYAQSKITQLHITNLIPNFAQELEYLDIGDWNCNGRSRNITFSSMDNESETETDPVYYEAESFYATPVGTTSNHSRSKSTNENEISIYEMSSTVNKIKIPFTSKAISEPIDIPKLDSLVQRFNVNDVAGLKNKTQIVGRVGKSLSDNALGMKPTVGQMDSCHFKIDPVIQNQLQNIQIKPNDRDDEGSNCDINELLTPVNENETIVSESYLQENLKENHHQNDLNGALNDLELSTVATAVDGKTKEKLHHSSVQRNQTSQALKIGLSRIISTGQQNVFPDGKYKGKAIHCDGNIFNILYTISSQDLPCGRKVFCVWICRDECDLEDDDEEDDGKHPNLTLTFNSIASNIETSVDGLPTAKRNSMNVYVNQSSRPNSVSLLSQYEDEPNSGEYNKYYTSLKQIGKGAFGYVKLSFRHSDRLLTVTKFILKDKLPPQFMIQTDDKKEIPMEVYLLSTLKHPNIVTVLDVFENEKFFQLVMEKFGAGMDLFEFIDRRPVMDEKLGSHIFRQIVNAIDYLHSLNILHRDIKDENIIIDQYFHVKLIDFGSATFMEEGKQFSTFYGTTEYCSPEVLAGNKYAGPELEIWALGITLFVLIFFENPFIDIEETLHSELHLPHTVSPALENTLTSMLDKNPKTRYTIKQLISDPWITQELGPCNFNFSWIVPCESHESNPEKYFTGQIYSSATGLSTTSPISLDEEDSIIDDDIEDEELCEESSSLQFNQEFDFRKCRKSNDVSDSKEMADPTIDRTDDSSKKLPTMLNATIINATSSKNIGKALIATPKSLSPLVTINNCKRNQMTLKNFSHLDSKKQSNTCKCVCSSAQKNKRAENNERVSSCDINHCIQHVESFSCDSISKSYFIPLADNIQMHKPSLMLYNSNTNAKLSVTTSAEKTPISPVISLSKSETNISESSVEDSQLSIYNVVSLNNLHDSEPLFNRTLNDLSENQCHDDLRKKHIVTLTNPKVLTVSMRNAADVSDF